jgi:hypothetical protein
VRLGACDGGSGGDEQAAQLVCAVAQKGTGPWSGRAMFVAALPRGVFDAPAHQKRSDLGQENNEIDRFWRTLY